MFLILRIDILLVIYEAFCLEMPTMKENESKLQNYVEGYAEKFILFLPRALIRMAPPNYLDIANKTQDILENSKEEFGNSINQNSLKCRAYIYST